MKRGFLLTGSYLSTKADVKASKSRKLTLQSKLHAQETAAALVAPRIVPAVDVFVIYQECPRIYLSDHRFPQSPYVGYLPAGTGTDQCMVLVDHEITKLEKLMKHLEGSTICNIDAVPSSKMPFRLARVPCKGTAMIAQKDISPGELIVQERPICVTLINKLVAPDQGLGTGDFWRSAFSRLQGTLQEKILSLSSCRGDMDRIPGILCTNMLPVDVHAPAIGRDRDQYGALYADLSRANHSCSPNANYFHHYPTFTGQLRACRHIKVGEEITVMYVDTLLPRDARRAILEASYRFICACPTCIMEQPDIVASDASRLVVQNALKVAWSFDPSDLSALDLEQMRNAINLARQEKLVAYEAQLLYACGLRLLRSKNTHAEEALQWLIAAKEQYCLIEGPDSSHVTELSAFEGLS